LSFAGNTAQIKIFFTNGEGFAELPIKTARNGLDLPCAAAGDGRAQFG
jgi:hypothetical protein